MTKVLKIILLIAPMRAFDRGLLQGIACYANEYGPWTFYREPPHYQSVSWKKKFSDRLRTGQIDGIIMREPEKINEIINSKIPGIAAPVKKRLIEGFINIITDSEAVAYMGAKHLLDCGLRHFAYCGFKGMYWPIDRGKAFQKYIIKAGYQCDIYEPKSLIGTKALLEEELPYLVDWLKSLPKPVGIMAYNDDRSRHILDACNIANIHVPSQVAIIGVDNDEFICRPVTPQLSSISMDPGSLGYKAARLLDQLMAGKKCRDTVIVGKPTHVVARSSTDILLVKDREISQAVRFIREHADQPLQVIDVAEGVAMSIRNLQQRFHKATGCYVHSHIERVRVDRIVQLLMETDLKIEQIANQLHFSSRKQLERVFTRVMGVTASSYRLQHRIN